MIRPQSIRSFLFLIIFFNTVLIGFSQNIELQNFASDFTDIVEITNAGDSRLFVVEQAGIIKILNNDGSVNATPFLDITSLVRSGGENGLLGLAFPSDYATTGRFYVNYTDNSSSNTNTIIARYTVDLVNSPNVANPTGTILLSYNQPFSNHNGGKIAFGPDNFLYISSGDGGSGGDPGDRAQNPNTLLGKLLRIDVSGASYSIPPTNPFSNSSNRTNDPRPEIYAIGLRNAWKFSFDKTNGDLWIADVGQLLIEEINKVDGAGTPGDNYGWRCFEGSMSFNSSGNCPPGGINNTIAPVAEYDHSGGKCSITGGYIYRGTSNIDFVGKYFFADLCSQEIGILTDTGSGWSMTLQTPNIAEGWRTFGEDNNGELYIAGKRTVYKLSDSSLSVTDINNIAFKLYPNPAKNDLNIELTNSFSNIDKITITNIQAQRINVIKTPNKQNINIKTSTYSSGLYFVEVKGNNNVKAIKKLIID